MKNKYIYQLIFMSFFAFSCEDFLEEDPRSFIAPTNFYQSDADALAAANGIYDVLTEPNMYGRFGLFLYGDVTSDIASGSQDSEFRDFNSYAYTAAEPALNGFWISAYRLIGRANTVIDEVNASEGVSQDVKDQVTGEALFLRALTHFNLVRVFGDVVLKTSAVTSVEGLAVPRTPEDEVYTQIIEDLEMARNLLPSDLDAGGRVTSWAATALQAKVQLNRGNYNEAASRANEVIGAGFELNPDFGDLFLNSSTNPQVEIIFSVQYSFPGETNQYPQFFISRELSDAGYGGEVFGVYEANQSLVDSYIVGDLRRDHTVWTDGSRVGRSDIVLSAPGLTKLITQAIANPTVPVAETGVNNFPVLRYADVLLMYAEAVVNGGGQGSLTAQEALDLVRSRAGLTSIPVTEASILEERKLELAGEGHRWFDLKRTNNLSNILGPLGFQVGTNEVFPIPQGAIDVNDQLIQNPNYN